MQGSFFLVDADLSVTKDAPFEGRKSRRESIIHQGSLLEVLAVGLSEDLAWGANCKHNRFGCDGMKG